MQITSSLKTPTRVVAGVALALTLLSAIAGNSIAADCSRLLITFTRNEGTNSFQHLGSEHPGLLLNRLGSVRFELLHHQSAGKLNVEPQGNSITAKLLRKLFAGRFPKDFQTERTIDLQGKELSFLELKKTAEGNFILRSYLEHLPPEGKKVILDAELEVKLIEGSWDAYLAGKSSITLRLTPDSQKMFLEKTKKAMRQIMEREVLEQTLTGAAGPATAKATRREPEVVASMFNVETLDPATYFFSGDSAHCLMGGMRCTAMFPIPERPR